MDSAEIAEDAVSSTIKDRIFLKNYKEKLLEIFKQVQNLSQNPNFSVHEEFLLEKIKTLVETERDKLATLNQAPVVSVTEKLHYFSQQINQLERKSKRKKKLINAVELRDPIMKDISRVFLDQLPKSGTPAQIVHRAQMKIIIVILYTTGARVNEIKDYEDFLNITKNGYLGFRQPKTGKYRNVYFGKDIIDEFAKIKPEIKYLFETLNFASLGCSLKNPQQTMTKEAWIRKVKKFLAAMKKEQGITLNLTSHSFRIGFINSILKKNDVTQAASVVGHKSLETTKRYL